jgi:hypothetical protein
LYLQISRALLDLVEHAIFGDQKSPYVKLFRAAGYEPGDVKTLMNQEGVRLGGEIGDVTRAKQEPGFTVGDSPSDSKGSESAPD